MSIGELILSIFGGAASGVTAVVFLSKRLVDQALAKDIENFRAELTGKTEHLKTQLSIYSNEHLTAFKRLDNQKAEAIHKVYTGIAKWKITSQKFVSDMPV